MKTLHLSLIMLTIIIFLGFGLKPAHADDANGISIQNINVQPSTVKVGDTFSVTATLVNNSTVPIVLDGGKCSIKDTQASFFTIMFDNHTKIKSKNLTCAGVGWSQILNPGKNIIGTSPDSTFAYIATESGTANVTVTFQYDVKNQTDPIQSNIGYTISKSFLFTIYDNNIIEKSLRLGNHPVTNKISSPLKQFKSGIATNDVKCTHGLQLVIKTEDNFPACVKPQTAQKLVEHGWGWAMQPIDSIKPSLPNRIAGLENDTGIVTFGNQTYYFVTPNYTDTAYSNPVQISFHNVIFTLFPSGFRGGLPIPCTNNPEELQYYWADAKFADSTHELLHILGDSPPCPTRPIPTMFSIHTNPQAGLTFYDGKMKLLVSVDNQVSQKENTTLPASFEPCDTPYPQSNTGIAVLYMPANSIGKICIRYSNSNDTPEPMFGIRVFDPNNSYKNATGITTWNDIGNNYTVPKGGSTVVYWIKTGNQTGFYGLVLSCVGTPFAVGYDNNSKIVSSDFPFLGVTNSCPVMLYDSHIDSLTGIGVKYIPYP